MEVLIVYIVMEWRSSRTDECCVTFMMKDERHYASAYMRPQKEAGSEAGFHDAKMMFHIMKNKIAQHHRSISFSEISFRIAKNDI